MVGVSSHRGSRVLGALVLAWAFANAPIAQAQTPIAALYASPDVTTSLGAAILADEDVVLDDLAGGVTPVPLGSLPRDADIEGYHLEANGDQLLVFDTMVELPGGITAEQRDIVHFDGSLYWIEFDGSAHGVPADAGIDAVTRSAGGDLLLSFDNAVDDAADEDLVRFDGTGFSPYFDGSSAGPGVAPELDLDAAHELPNGHLLLSFDATGVVDGIGHSDEDLLEFDSATGTWLLAFDASEAATPWPASSDLDAVAVPEPGAGLMLVAGVPVIVFMARRRVTR